jgi:predicted DNA-binding transcriptional regulator AlpA
MSYTNVSEAPRFKSLPEVSQITQLGKSTILAWEVQGRFPKAIRLSKTRRVWLEQDIHHWILSHHAERLAA